MLKSLLSYLSGKEKTLYFLVTILAGIILLWPLHDFQHFLSQGDHGRDLYCFKKVLDGALPYRDFSWLFGPLMPYYYAFFYLIGGVSIQSVLLGQNILIFLTGIMFYKTCSVFVRPGLSFVCALWYWTFRGTEFFYTYNHSGGVLALLVVLYCAFKYIEKSERRHIYIGFASIFALLLIRLNMGLFTLLAWLLSLLFTDFIRTKPKGKTPWRIYFYLTLAILSATVLIYSYLLHPLPGYAIYQSFPYGKMQRTDFSASAFDSLLYFGKILITFFTKSLPRKIFGLLLLLSTVECGVLLFSKKTPLLIRKNTLLAFLTLFLFLVMTSHEFIASGVFYRGFWMFPVFLIVIFCLIGTATRNVSSPILKALIFFTLFLAAARVGQTELRIIRAFKTPTHQLHIGPNKIYTLQNPVWFKTVTNAVTFIQKKAKPDDKILVLPLDPLYLFLTGHDSATRQLVFFEHINIPPAQERKILSEMEDPRVNWAIISNRSVSMEGGMGVFGRNYCPLLARYLSDHFQIVANFGNWQVTPGWGWDHAVTILKRKSPEPK